MMTLYVCAMSSMTTYAQTMADVLRTMPDTIIPLLTHNDRLDLVDEWEGGVKAEARNRLGGLVVLTHMDDTSAHLKMSELSELTIELRNEGTDNEKYVRLIHSCTVDGITDQRERRFTLYWQSK